MIALTLRDRRTREAFTVVVPDGWKPDATVYDTTRRVALPPGSSIRATDPATQAKYIWLPLSQLVRS